MEVVRHWNIRTGWHGYLCVLMPDGELRAVWMEFDGPQFLGYYTAGPNVERRKTDRADYEEYRRRRRFG